MGVLVEVCCGGVDDAIAAARGGADRIELNSALFLGGLTPTMGELLIVKEHVGIPVLTMVRPREGGFDYSRRDFETMCCDAAALVDGGSDGIVFGILTPDGRIDAKRCETLIRAARRFNPDVEIVFSRAIDVVSDVMSALDLLEGLGVDRVLTSGRAATALEGAGTIRAMREHAGRVLEFVAGAGVTADNVAEVVKATGVTQVHGSFRKARRDSSCAANPSLNFGGSIGGNFLDESVYRTCDEATVMDVLVALGRGDEVAAMKGTGV